MGKPHYLARPNPNHMNPDKQLDQVARLLKALSHPSRIRIVQLLHQNGAMNVSAVVRALNLEQSMVSHLLIKMADKGMLVSRRQGKEIHYSLADSALSEAVALAVR